MKILRAAIVVVLALLLLAGVVRAQAHYALLTVEVPVDASMSSDLMVIPETLVADALRPGDQAAYDVVVENRGILPCKEVFATQRQSSEYLAVQTWPIEELAPMESAVVRVIVTVHEDAPDMTVLSYELGLVCVQ